jgi:hypothetical protein
MRERRIAAARRRDDMRTGWRAGEWAVAAAMSVAALVAVMAVAGWGTAGAQEPPQPAPHPSPQQEPAKETPPAPPAGETPAAAPAAAPEAGAVPAPAPEAPRIIRVVCTDHICGNCDGKCHKNGGHVAVDKKGHCACTPTEGSALDRATRDAYAKSQPK